MSRLIRTPFLIAVIAVGLFSSWSGVDEDSGIDFALYCAAVRAADAGANPYDLDVLRKVGAPPGVQMTNPAVILPALRPLCRTENYKPFWLIAAAAAIVLIGMADRGADWLLLTALLLAGFEALAWMLNTGNLAVFEMLLVGVALTAWNRRRAWTFAAGLGAAAFLKLLPAVFAAVPLLQIVVDSGKERRSAITALAGIALIFVALHVLHLAMMPHLAALYWGWMFNDLGGFLGSEAIYGGRAHPSMLSLLSDASASLSGRSWPALPLYVFFVAVVLFDVARMAWTFRDDGAQRRQLLLAATCLGLVAVLPRLKPYSFGLVLAPLYLAAKVMPPRGQIMLVAIACLTPIVARGLGDARILGYGQLFALLGAYLAVRHGIYSMVGDKRPS